METENTVVAALTRGQIRKILSRKHGAASSIARDLGLSRVTVSQWLRGKMTSKRIAEAAHAKALLILQQKQNGEKQ